MFKNNISLYILYIIICSWKFLLLEPKIQQSVKTNSEIGREAHFFLKYCIIFYYVCYS